MSDAPMLLLGTRKGALAFESNGAGYELAHVWHAGIPVTYAASDPRDGTLWTLLDHGHWGQKLARSRDAGETWQEVAPPVYPEDARRPNGEAAKLRFLWTMQAGGADQPGRLWFGTEPGGLFRSDDAGASFELVRSLWEHPTHTEQGWFGGGRDTPGIHSILVDPRDSRRITIAISCAGVFESRDDGASWSVRNKGLKADFLPDPAAEVGQDPHCVTRCAAEPDVLWQQNHCGIYRSTDCGANWQQVSQDEGKGPAHFGFPIATDERDPEVAWVVPGQSDQKRMAIDGALCVCRTQDGGKSWQRLDAGLPQRAAFDVVFRHALDVAGDRLAFGSTTGNLYASDDRGARFRAVGQNLPPIYSVRFVR